MVLAKGGGQLAFEDASSSDGIRYFDGEVRCLIKGGKGSSFEIGNAQFYGTVNEDPTCLP